MKTLLLLPLFALLPFIAFPNGTPEIPKKEKEDNIELTDTKTNDNTDIKDCTVILYRSISYPVGDITYSCESTASTCKRAEELAYECIGKVMPPVGI